MKTTWSDATSVTNHTTEGIFSAPTPVVDLQHVSYTLSTTLPTASHSAPDVHETTVLIVDDCIEVTQYLELVLKQIGITRITQCHYAEEAQQQLQTKPWDLVILDIELPDQNGKNLLDIIMSAYPGTKVIMCSSHNTVENVKESWELGAKGFIIKPVNPEKLHTIIRRLLPATD